jgi:hypothetical protein
MGPVGPSIRASIPHAFCFALRATSVSYR